MCRCFRSARCRHGTAEAEQVRDDDSRDRGKAVALGAEAVPSRDHAVQQNNAAVFVRVLGYATPSMALDVNLDRHVVSVATAVVLNC